MQLPMHSDSTSTSCCRRDEFEDWLQIIRSEYAEMPGLHLSRRQAQRLWGLDAECCQALLDTLESKHYLKRTEKDMYMRADIGTC
jgi:hypothetical protein